MEKRLSESEPQPSHSAWLRLAVIYIYIYNIQHKLLKIIEYSKMVLRML